MKLKIVHYPHPALVHATKPVPRIDKQLNLQIGAMLEAMYEAKGLGLAANQVALPYQLLVTNLSGDAKDPAQEAVYINPVIVERKGSQDGEEGCLSFPGLFQKVHRSKTVKVHAYNLKGDLVEITADDLAARCWQHELDHLNGVMFIEKMGPIARLSSRGSLKEFERKFREAQKRGEIPSDAELEKILKALEEGGETPPNGNGRIG
jgi:peptide deformylase